MLSSVSLTAHVNAPACFQLLPAGGESAEFEAESAYLWAKLAHRSILAVLNSGKQQPMAEVATQLVIAPIKGEIAFQDFCLELARLEWNDPDAETHGRRGQGQNGVDITGTDKAQGRGRAGMQCKGSESNAPRALTLKEFDDEVTKAKTLRPALGVYIVAFTGPRDATLSNRAAEYREQHKAEGLFEVYAWSWDEITERASRHPALVERLRRMVWPEPEVQPALAPRRPDGNAQLELLKDQFRAMTETIRYIDETPKADPADTANNAKIDLLRDFIRSGDSEAARGQLLAFISSLSEDTNPRIWFRAYANLGAAYVSTSQFDLAAEAFDSAAAKEGETADGFSYRARAAQVRRNDSECYANAKRALSLDAANVLAASLLIETAPEGTKTEDLEAEVTAVRTNGDVGWALSRRYSQGGLADEALRCAMDVVDDPTWTKPIAVADALLNTFDNDLDVRMGIQLSTENRARLERAVSEYEKAWAIIKTRRDRTLWIHTVMNLNAAYRMSGRDAEADALALDAYTWAPEVEAVQMRAALAHLHAGQFETAQALAEKLAGIKTDAALFAAHMCAAAKDYPKTLKWAQKALDETEGRDKMRAAELLVLALEQTEAPDKALAKALVLEKEVESAPSFLARIAELARRSLDQAVLERVRTELDAFEIGSLDPVERFELGEAYADDEQWSKAADAIEGMYALDHESVLLKRRLYALLQADRRQDARALFESLSPKVKIAKGISRLGAAIYERSGQLKEAIDQLTEALKIGPEDLRTRLDWVRLNLRESQEEVVRKWVRKADLSLAGGTDDLMEFAQVLSRFGRHQEAVKLGYQTLRAAWGTSETAHVKYTSLFLLRGGKKEAWLDPKVAGIDTEVTLKRANGETSIYRIEAGPPTAGRIAPDHPLAVALIGKKKGDHVTLPEGIGEAVDWTIEEVKHVYLALFHQVMKEHAALFPGNTSFGMFSVDPQSPQGFEPLLESLRARARTGQEVLELYKTANVPIDFVAEVLGSDVLDVASVLRWTSNLTLDTCHGGSQERDEAFAQLAHTGAFLVDDLTLGLWDEVGLLETLRDKGVRVQVVQATIDKATARIEKAKLSIGERGGVMAAVGDRFQYTEIPASVRKDQVTALEARLERVRELVDIVPTEAWKPGTFPAGIDDVLSESSKDTVSTAIATGVPVVCDDRRLRALARDLGVQASGWTQPFLLTLVEKGSLSKRDYATTLAKLAENRIGFISVDALDLVSAIVADDVETLNSLLKCLTAATVDPVSLVQVADVFLTVLWVRPTLKASRERFSSALLEQILANRKEDQLGLIQQIFWRVRRGLERGPFPSNFIAGAFHNYMMGFILGHFLPTE